MVDASDIWRLLPAEHAAMSDPGGKTGSEALGGSLVQALEPRYRSD